MKAVAELKKPYTGDQHIDFLLENKIRNNYEIEYSDDAIIAWDKTEEDILADAKEGKRKENSTKAREAIDNGWVEFKEARIETNTRTSSDLSDARDICLATGEDTYSWFSMDNKLITLNVNNNPKEDDFVKLKTLITKFKNDIWLDKYRYFDLQIENAKNIEELNEITLDYSASS